MRRNTRRKRVTIMKKLKTLKLLNNKKIKMKRRVSKIIQTTTILTKQIPKQQVKITRQPPNWKR
jgi:hypothetical protein|tara:strand:- start:162 stop:353 length:192 start_codon:yes stop_codon:yes gene_type:complete